jgi:oligoribonuclease
MAAMGAVPLPMPMPMVRADLHNTLRDNPGQAQGASMTDATTAPVPATTITVPTLERADTHLVWIDMEMTGLDPATDRIIEIAIVVTDAHLGTRVEGPVIAVHQSDATLDGMDNWNKGTHGKSGLIDRVKASAYDEAAAEAEVLAFMQQFVGKRISPMCGNSICQDRRFMANGMPKLEAYFHYRNLDVSTLKELAKRWKPSIADGFKKHQKHTALADIHESIDELVYYREHLLAL